MNEIRTILSNVTMGQLVTFGVTFIMLYALSSCVSAVLYDPLFQCDFDCRWSGLFAK